MTDEKLEELREYYKNRNLMEELNWATYHDHSGYMRKSQAEFLNWLFDAAVRRIKELEEEVNDQRRKNYVLRIEGSKQVFTGGMARR